MSLSPPLAMSDGWQLADELIPRCTFPDPQTPVTVAYSGGPDSTALLALAVRVGLDVTAVHVDHGLRVDSTRDATLTQRAAQLFGVKFRLHRTHTPDGPNLEARARHVRRELLGVEAMTGHTADDQAETVLLALLRGSGSTGLAGMRPGYRHPILGLRRAETHELCSRLGINVAVDATNASHRFRRNRVRHELLPLLNDIADRDVATLIDRTATLIRDDDDLLNKLASEIDPTDVNALRATPAPLARRALRRWLSREGYPPDAAAIERVFNVVYQKAAACELQGGRRITRSAGRLHLTDKRRN